VIRRRFFDTPSGQIHYRYAEGRAGPSRPTLFALHQASGSAKSLLPVVEAFARTRRVVAPDLPGNGDSSPLSMREPGMTDYASSLLPMIDAEPSPIDLYGFHAGASVALEIAIARPAKVRRLILDSLGLYPEGEREAMVRDYVPDFPLDPHGAHLMRAWHMVRDTYLFWPWFRQDAAHARAVGVPPVQTLHDKVLEVVKSLDTFGDLYRAAFRHDKAARLPMVMAPTLVTSGRSNTQYGHLDTLARLLPRASVLETDGTYTHAATQATVNALCAWLDGNAA
jgi:pimeloyl-ACP methyl ester carboxylesterase